MKRRFLILLSTLFALAAISLVILQISQTRKSARMSDNLFNISVNNAIDKVFGELDQMKVEDFVSQKERYWLIRMRRIDEMNEKMQTLIRENSDLFYDDDRLEFGISTQDSVLTKPHTRFTPSEEHTITQYNTLLNSRNRLIAMVQQSPERRKLSFQGASIDPMKLNFPLLDSLIREELIINGVDLKPSIGILQTAKDALLYYSADADTNRLRTSPFKYNFQSNGVISDENLYVVLYFPASPIFLNNRVTFYTMISISLILLITFLFVLSVRTILLQRKLDEMKTDFISNMTHEIKTPIATISLACEMLQDKSVTSDSASTQNFVNIISDENRRMRVLIETLLLSAKMAGKRFSIAPKEVDLNALVSDSLQSFRLSIDSRHGELHTDLQPINGILFADELHVTNLIHNLVDNAIKYSDKELYISVSTREENGYAILQITDHGIGIAKEDQKHIFEKFYRVSTGNVHNVKGFGIGLNYVSQIVALHKGKIAVASTPGQGSTFTIQLPLEK